MNLTPQVETAEMSEADLDNIAGGLAAGASAGVFAEVDAVAAVCAGVGVGVNVEGVSADVVAHVAAL
ncbi:type A2 lantipeptide [Streptomyces leeuwenhoekii]|uniref:Uncharacterized protein n=1 Tax=Streptomyces leeuwenhoekii TaxID=1437453 RepID=A0A0F7VRY8_STRLW|nr:MULTISPECIES: hypothetical protein [Streptomyces]KMS80532.1 hypothetical protein ACH49_07165 [Streptomyces leeuwenhoekii]CQR62545.1 Hypothetical Protein sle_30840 [Streptomyces leeuwenhoekii]